MNLLFFSLLYPNLRSQFLRLRNPNLLYLILDGNSDLGLDGVVDGARGEAGGIGAESKSRDVVVAVAEELGIVGQDKRVADGDCGVGGGGRHDVVGLLVPHHRAVQRPPVAARGPLGASKRYLGLRFDLGFDSFSSIFVGLLIFLDFGDED
ncbi:unnamed protein product [Malus baccata var. baccata]